MISPQRWMRQPYVGLSSLAVSYWSDWRWKAIVLPSKRVSNGSGAGSQPSASTAVS